MLRNRVSVFVLSVLAMVSAGFLYLFYGVKVLTLSVFTSLISLGLLILLCNIARRIDNEMPHLGAYKRGFGILSAVACFSIFLCVDTCEYLHGATLYLGLIGMVVYLSIGFCCGFCDSVLHEFLVIFGIALQLFEGGLLVIALCTGKEIELQYFIISVAIGVILACIRAYSFGDMLLYLSAICLETFLWNGRISILVGLFGLFLSCVMCAIRMVVEKWKNHKIQSMEYHGKSGYVRFSLELVAGQVLSICCMNGIIVYFLSY